jgi:hypothetical protein
MRQVPTILCYLASRVNLTLTSQVLTGDIPYSRYKGIIVLEKIQAGETLQRPSDKITGPLWEFLEKCWSRDPNKRPSIAQVCEAFSNPESPPQAIFSNPQPPSQATRAPERRQTAGEPPGKQKFKGFRKLFA